MLRKQIRQRKEYLYKKSKEQQELSIYERKQKLKSSIESNQRIPAELKGSAKESEKLRSQLFYDESQEKPTTHIDDEYYYAGTRDPKIVITTSRDCSSRLLQFSKEMALLFPNSQRINRGNYVMKELVDACKQNDCTDLVIFHEHRGVPDSMIVSHFPYGPTAYFTLHNVVLRHDLEKEERGTVSQAYPHLIFHNMKSKLGERVSSILKHLFPVPKEDSKRVVTFANDNDYISFRHHVYQKLSAKNIELVEVGPRFELRLFKIQLGTVDLEAVESEWALRPFMRTSKKREFLAAPFEN